MIENCPGPEELTGIAIPECKIVDEAAVSRPARLQRRGRIDVAGPEELTGITIPSLRDHVAVMWASDYFVGPIPMLKVGAALIGGVAGFLVGTA